MSRWIKVSVSLVALTLLAIFAASQILPGQIRSRAVAWVAERTGRTLTLGVIRINPLTLTVEIRDLDLREPDGGRSFLSFERLRISFSSRSLIDRALIVDALELDAPVVLLERTGERSFNFSDFLPPPDRPAPAPAEPDRPFHFSLNNLVVRNGALDLADLTRPTPLRHAIRRLELSVPVIGNVPYLADRYVEPALSLLFDDSPVRAEGQLKPFADSMETTLGLKLRDLDLSHYVGYAPTPLPFQIATGRLAVDLDISYRVTAARLPRLPLGGEILLTGLNLREPSGAPLLTLPMLQAQIDFIDLAQRQFALTELSIYGPELYLARSAAGAWNLQRLLPPAAAAPAAIPSATEEPPRVAIETVRLRRGQLHFTDAVPPGGFAEELREINLHLRDFSNLPDNRTAFQFELQSERGLRFAADGRFGLTPLTASTEFQLRGLPLAPYYPYLTQWLMAPVSGRAQASGRLDYAGQGLRLDRAAVALEDLAAPFGGEDRLLLAGLFLEGGTVDFGRHTASVEAIRIDRADLKATRLPDGRFSPQNLLRPQSESIAGAGIPASEETDPDWQARVGKVAVTETRLHLADATLGKPGVLDIDRLNFQIADLVLPEAAASPYSLTCRINRRGNLTLAGSLVHSPLKVSGRLQIDRLPLPPLAPWLPPRVKLELTEGRLDSRLRFALHQDRTGWAGTLGGTLGVRGLELRDRLVGEPMLAWESLQFDGLKVDLAPLQLGVAEVALNNYLAKILITEEGRINLTSVAAEAQAEAAPEAPPVAPEPKPGTAGPAPEVRIDRVTLQGGTVEFTDRNLPRHFSTTMYQLGGRISGLNSTADRPAEIDLRGQLENHSPMRILGQIDPLRDQLFLDLEVTFDNIDLAPVTPYSGTYLGYAVEKGKLFLKLDYHIENRQVTASNQVFLDQFTFGEAVASDRATSLPVRLAVALLKDRKGEIHLDLPVSGRTDDPKFGIWSAVFTILKNLLVKAATAPFSLLAALFSGGDEADVSRVAFAPGSTDLTAAEQQKLLKLHQILVDRPALRLEVSGFADREQDPDGYRQLELQRRLQAARPAPAAESPAAPEGIGPEDYPQLLEKVYRQADFPKPRNFLGMVKRLPAAEMEKLLLTNIRAGDQQLEGLAAARAAAVKDFLLQQGDGLAARIFLKSAPFDRPPEEAGLPASRVEFGITVN
jgi:uncharacterized protein involved in outer membrane biogenesis